MEMIPSLGMGCLGGSLWIPEHPKLAEEEKAGSQGRRLLALLAGNPLLAGLQVVEGRSPGGAEKEQGGG